MSTFKSSVTQIIRCVPYGKVASYGQIAAIAGVPRAARQVGWILNQSEGKTDLPWWRIINNAGRISIKNTQFNTPLLQKKMLEHEGIFVTSDYTLDIEKYRFRPSQDFLKALQLSDLYIEKLIVKYGL